jgi:hypothetical protein
MTTTRVHVPRVAPRVQEAWASAVRIAAGEEPRHDQPPGAATAARVALLGQVREHQGRRIRRVDLGDHVRYEPTGATSTVRGLLHDTLGGPTPRLWAMVDLPAGPAWVPTVDLEVLAS